MKTLAPVVNFLLLLLANTVTGYVCPDGRNVECNRVCLLIYQPVCGTDWRTYSNTCTLDTVRECCGLPIYVWHMGECHYPHVPYMSLAPPVAHRFFPFLPFFNQLPAWITQNRLPVQQPPTTQNQILPQVLPNSKRATAEEATLNGASNTASVPVVGTIVSTSSVPAPVALPSQQLQVETDETNELEPLPTE